MTSPTLSRVWTSMTMAPRRLTFTVKTFSLKVLPLASVPKMRTGTRMSLRGSRRVTMVMQRSFAWEGASSRGHEIRGPNRRVYRIATRDAHQVTRSAPRCALRRWQIFCKLLHFNRTIVVFGGSAHGFHDL